MSAGVSINLFSKDVEYFRALVRTSFASFRPYAELFWTWVVERNELGTLVTRTLSVVVDHFQPTVQNCPR